MIVEKRGVKEERKMKVFEDEEIRDTEAHSSTVYKMAEIHARGIMKSIIYKNGLNKACSLQVQGSVDEAFTDPVDVGNAISAGASMSAALYETESDYFPFLRIEATCTEAPTSGSLAVWIVP